MSEKPSIDAWNKAGDELAAADVETYKKLADIAHAACGVQGMGPVWHNLGLYFSKHDPERFHAFLSVILACVQGLEQTEGHIPVEYYEAEEKIVDFGVRLIDWGIRFWFRRA